MEIEYIVETDDLVEFASHQRDILRPDDGPLKFFWWLMVPGLITALVIFAGADFLAVAFIFSVFFIVYAVWMKAYVKRSYRAWYSKPSAGGLVGKHRLIIEPDYFVEVTDFRETVCRWERVAGIFHTARHTFIYLNRIQAHVIPRRAFRDDAEFQEFQCQLEQFSGKRAGQMTSESVANAAAEPAGDRPASSGGTPTPGDR